MFHVAPSSHRVLKVQKEKGKEARDSSHDSTPKKRKAYTRYPALATWNALRRQSYPLPPLTMSLSTHYLQVSRRIQELKR